MQNSLFLHYLTLSLWKHRSKHIGAVFISMVIIFLLSATLFLSSSLQYTLLRTLEGEPDFTVTRIEAGRAVNTPVDWVDEMMEIEGVSALSSRVYGRYFFTPKGRSFLIVGVDFFDEQSMRLLRSLVTHIDMKDFLSEDAMIVGSGVARFLQAHYFDNSFSFKTPQGIFKEVKIYATLPKESNLMSNDMIIMPIDLAREIFGMRKNEVTDITFNVPNDAERDTIASKIQMLFYDVRVIQKKEIKKAYEVLYNYKGGLFLSLYLVALVTFMMILYQRFAMVYSTERKEIGTLRALGWSIRDVLRLKLFENLMIVMISFSVALLAAYCYVFMLDAPLLRAVFLGSENLPNSVSFVPIVPFGLLVTLFLLYAVPFLSTVLIPAWRVAVTPPKEAML